MRFSCKSRSGDVDMVILQQNNNVGHEIFN